MGRIPDEDLVIDKTIENPPHKNAAGFLLLMHNITFFRGNFRERIAFSTNNVIISMYSRNNLDKIL